VLYAGRKVLWLPGMGLEGCFRGPGVRICLPTVVLSAALHWWHIDHLSLEVSPASSL
jgi:hypothetical protein